MPTNLTVQGSWSRETEPVTVISAEDEARLASAIEDALGAPRRFVTVEERDSAPTWITVERTGVKNWRAFERGALHWYLYQDPQTKEYRMTAGIPAPKGGWEFNKNKPAVFTLPPNTPLSEVAQRAAIAIRAASEGQSRR